MKAIAGSRLKRAACGYASLVMKDNDISHDYNHVKRVYRNAAMLIDSLDKEARDAVDILVVGLGAILHDVADHKYVPSDPGCDPVELCLDHLRRQGGSEITEDRLHKVGEIMRRTSYSQHMREPPGTASFIELDLVRDADRLDALGRKGLARMMAFGGARGERAALPTTPTIEEWGLMGCPKLEDDGSLVGHFYSKLFHLPPTMTTELARMLGRAMADEMLPDIDEFVEEERLVI